MAEISTTQSFSDGDTVTATKLNNIQANASIQPEVITNRTAETTVDQANDLLLMYDASATALKKVSPSNLIKAGTASDFPITGNATIGGTLGVTGNASLAGTLGVTGASTLTGNTSVGGTLGVTGNVSVNTNKFNVTAASGNTSIAGTLGVSGDATLSGNLSVTGNSVVKAGTVSSPAIQPTGDTNTGIFFPTADTIAFSEGGTESMRIDSSGNVGIGTTSPSTKLDVLCSPNAGIRVTDGTQVGIMYASGVGGIVAGTTSTHPYILYSNNTERLRIDSSGNVGIGTTSPQAKLDVQGGRTFLSANNEQYGLGVKYINTGGPVYFGALSNSATPDAVISNAGGSALATFTNAGNVGIGTTSPIRKLSIEGGGLAFQSAGGTNRSVSWIDSTTTAAPVYLVGDSTSSGCYFAVNTNSFGSSGIERLRIDSSGNVGIGTASPSTKLHVSGVGIYSAGAGSPAGIDFAGNGNTAQTNSLYVGQLTSGLSAIFERGANPLTFHTNASERLRIDSSGNVGIGVTPSAWGSSFVGLQVGGASSIWTDKTNGLRTFINTNTYFDGTNRKYLGNGAASEYLQGTDGSHAWYSAGSGTAGSNITMSERLRIDSSGNVGIGTTSPSRQLHVKSTALIDSNGDGTTGVPSLSIGALLTGFSHIATNNIVAITNGTERLRITSGGKLQVGTSTNQGGKVDIAIGPNGGSDDIGIVTRNATDGNFAMQFKNTAGTSQGYIVVNASSVSYVSTSDYRLKTNLEPILNGIDRIKELPVYRFNWIVDESGNKVDGFVAHEAQAIVPECVTGEKDAVDADGKPIYQGIDQSKIVPLLTAALKEAIAKIETLESKVATLEAA